MHARTHDNSSGPQGRLERVEPSEGLPEGKSEQFVGTGTPCSKHDEREAGSLDKHDDAPPEPVMLAREQILGLSPWFTNPDRDDQIDRILRAGFLGTWVSRVENRLVNIEDFQPESGRPKSWHGLGKALGKNGQGFTRYPRTGSVVDADRKPSVPDLSVRHLVAWAIQVPEAELAPDTAQWIGESARFLVLHFKSDSEKRLPPDAYIAYGDYMYLHFGRHDARLDRTITRQLDQRGFERVEDLEMAVGEVACAIGSSILANDLQISSLEWERKDALRF